MVSIKNCVAACPLLLLAVSQNAFALTACESGQIALGTVFVHVSIHAEGTIFDDTCTPLDHKSNDTDASVCGEFFDGSSVTCDASGVPQSGVLSNGTAFGNCIANDQDCDNINKVQFCCSPL